MAGGSMSSSPTCPVIKQPQPINPKKFPFFRLISEDIFINVFVRLELPAYRSCMSRTTSS
uniref:Uncharacterized protein n=1 Tax=Physcomitrium patens TaxID=3218 RepID=A0A2K1JRV2_PHYPA|nr:hypothetical protein PHYPA_016644 [Physcomitrium patens]